MAKPKPKRKHTIELTTTVTYEIDEASPWQLCRAMDALFKTYLVVSKLFEGFGEVAVEPFDWVRKKP